MKREHEKYILDNLGGKSVKNIARDLGIKEKKIRKFLEHEHMLSKKIPLSSQAENSKGEMIKIRGRFRSVVLIMLILIVGIGIYANSLNNEFVLDDISHVVDNTVIRSFRNIPQAFSHDLTYFGMDDYVGGYYRPILTMSFMIDHFLWGLDPAGFRLTNVLLHTVVSMLLFYVVFLLSKSFTVGALTSLVYLVHPVHNSAVAYVSGRADSLIAIFLLSILVLQYRWWKCVGCIAKTLYYFLIILLLLLALLSKELAVIFPFLLMFFEYCFRDSKGYTCIKGRKLVFYVPIFLVVGGWFILKNSTVSTEVLTEQVLSMNTRFTALPRIIFDYVRLSFIPLNLHMEHKLPFARSLFQPGYFEPIFFIIPFLYAIFVLWSKGKKDANFRLMFFGAGWFLIALFPYMSIVFPLNALFAEHWLYVPEMGLILSVIFATFYISRNKKPLYGIIVAIFISCILFFSYLTIRQNRVWKDSLTFYSYTLKYSPYSAKIYNNLAFEYIKLNDLSKAVELLETAVRVEPDYTDAQRNLQMLKKKGQTSNLETN